VEIGARGGVDQVALGGEERDHDVAGDTHAAPAGALKDLQRLIQDVVCALEPDLVVAGSQELESAQFLLRGRFQPDPGQLLVRGRDRHFRYLLVGSMKPSPCSSILY
jgi:hypothetical protein